jgi:hypothetical protein
MPQYHIRPDGTPGICKATAGKCPYGGRDQHYNSKEEAYDAFQKQMENQNANEAVIQRANEAISVIQSNMRQMTRDGLGNYGITDKAGALIRTQRNKAAEIYESMPVGTIVRLPGSLNKEKGMLNGETKDEVAFQKIDEDTWIETEETANNQELKDWQTFKQNNTHHKQPFEHDNRQMAGQAHNNANPGTIKFEAPTEEVKPRNNPVDKVRKEIKSKLGDGVRLVQIVRPGNNYLHVSGGNDKKYNSWSVDYDENGDRKSNYAQSDVSEKQKAQMQQLDSIVKESYKQKQNESSEAYQARVDKAIASAKSDNKKYVVVSDSDKGTLAGNSLKQIREGNHSYYKPFKTYDVKTGKMVFEVTE